MKGRVLPLTAVLLALGAQPASAAFPGTNGPIAYEQTPPAAVSIASLNGDGTGEPRELVRAGATDRDPAWSPDGRRLAFTSTRDGNEEIYVLDLRTGVQIRMTSDASRDHDPSWSPDGTRLAFASNRDGNPELYVMSAAGGPARRLTFDPADDEQPAWSPGRAIAFSSDRGPDRDIYVVDEQGGAVAQVSHDPGSEADPSWAPGGTRLAYSHRAVGGPFEILAIDVDGRNPGFVAFGQFPAWSPDGTKIAYTLTGTTLAVVGADGGGGGSIGGGVDPSWGPLPAPVAPPDPGRTFNISPAGDRVLVAPSTTERPATDPTLQAQLRTPAELPVGSTIDASSGTVAVDATTTTPDGPNTVGHAEISGGVFTATQNGGGEPTFKLLPGIRPCQGARISRVPPEARMRIRARGRFRTVGGYGRGAARGTDWAVRERCDGTIFQVFEGVVRVHDYRRGANFDVRAGRCYLAAKVRRTDALKPHRRCPPVRKRK